MNEKLKGNLKLDLKNITERKQSKSKSKEKERSITDMWRTWFVIL